jgi:hypothetical protein
VSLAFMQSMSHRTTLISRKITLLPQKALDIEPNWHSVRVLSGRAWINSDGTNISLASGQRTLVMKESDSAMIFAASRAVIQVFYQPAA